MRAVNLINRMLRRAELYIGAVLTGVIFILTTVNIVLRYFFSRPILWAEEVVKFSFLWLGFLAVAYTLSYNNHVRFTLLLEKLPKKANIAVNILFDLMIAAVFVILYPSMLRCFRFLIRTPALQVNEKYFYWIVPVGYALFIVHSLLNITRHLFPSAFDDKPPYKPDREEAAA